MADLLTKRGTNILQKSSRDLPLHSAKHKINGTSKKCFCCAAAAAAKNKSWKVLLKNDFVLESLCAAIVAEFRL